MQSKPLINRINNFSYLLEDMIGKGAAGKVYQGINELTGEQVAIKILEMSEIDNEVTKYLLACEKEALLSIKCQYVLFAYEIIQKQHQCYIITPMCTGGTLKQYIQSKGKLQEGEASSIFLKLLYGYKSIKQKQFIHRDLKSSNIMFNKGDPIIIDFGYCQKTNGSKPKVFYNVGSPSYMSPQAYYKTIYSQKSDLWALGIILYEMLEGNTVDFGIGIDRYFGNLVKNGVSFRGNYSEQYKRVLRDILNPNPTHRPGVEQLIQKIEQLRSSGGQNHTRQVQSHSQPHFKPQSHPLPQSHHQAQFQNYPHMQQHPYTQPHGQQPQQIHQYQVHQNHYQGHQPNQVPLSNKMNRQNGAHLQSTQSLKLNQRFVEQQSEFVFRNGEVPMKTQHYQQMQQAPRQNTQQNWQSQQIHNSQNVHHRNTFNANIGTASNQQIGEPHQFQHYQAIPQYRHTLPAQNYHFVDPQHQNQNQMNHQHHQQQQIRQQPQQQPQQLPQHQRPNYLAQRFSQRILQPHEQIHQHGQIQFQNQMGSHKPVSESNQTHRNQVFISSQQRQQQPQYSQQTQHIHQNIHHNQLYHHTQNHPQSSTNQFTNKRHQETMFINQNNHVGNRWPASFGEPQRTQHQNGQFFQGQARNEQSRPQSQMQERAYQSRPQSIILTPAQNNHQFYHIHNPQTPQNPHHSLFLPMNNGNSYQRTVSSTMLAQPPQSTFVPFEHVPNIILTDSVHHTEVNSSFQQSNQNNNLQDRMNLMNQSNTFSHFSLRSSLQNNHMNHIQNLNNLNNVIRNGHMVNSLIINPQSNQQSHQRVNPNIGNPVYRSFMLDGRENNFHNQQHHFGNPVQQRVQTQQAQQVQHQIPIQVQQFPQGNPNFPQQNSAQIPIHNIRQEVKMTNRPFSPIAVERRSMPINEEYIIHPEYHVPSYPTQFQEQPQQPKNFMKKAEPYFHMSSKDPQIPTNQKPKVPITKILYANRVQERKKQAGREVVNVNIGYY